MFELDTQKKGKGEKPELVAYHVRDAGEGKSFWTRIGVAWMHQDGKGYNADIDVLPLNGRIVLRVPKPADEEKADQTEA